MMAYADAGTDSSAIVRPALRGEEIWCQLFSEPAGGSDLAALRTRRASATATTGSSTGRRSGPSGAHLSDFGIIVARTDPNVPKHEGLTIFFLDMRSPGIEIRPIQQMSGGVGLQRGVLHRRAGAGQPAAGRGGRRLEGVAHHADERAAGGGRARRPGLSRTWSSCAASLVLDGAPAITERRGAREASPTGTSQARG